jgi:small conductance mechanosensitive channel
MKEFLKTHFSDSIVDFAGKICVGAIVLILGYIIIRQICRHLPNSKIFSKMEPSAKSFIISTLKILFYACLIITVISILGVPTTSIIAAITSAFLAVGLALQGALSNFAGGVMILMFRPFKVGDYITCSGGTGTVKDISVFYTSIVTDDNNRVTIPNGTLMNESVVNHTAEDLRRVDLRFTVPYGTALNELSQALTDAAFERSETAKTPQPVLRVLSYTDTGMVCMLCVWCKASVYWDLYYYMMRKIEGVLGQLGISSPVSRVICDIKEK